MGAVLGESKTIFCAPSSKKSEFLRVSVLSGSSDGKVLMLNINDTSCIYDITGTHQKILISLIHSITISLSKSALSS